MTGMLQDLRYALRQLRKSLGFSIVAVITLALGIGANTAVFSLINAVLLKMLPVKDPEQLVKFSKAQPVNGPNDYFSYPEVERFQRELPLTQFVYPARTGVALPDEFTKYTVVPSTTLSLDAATIAANRQKWQDEWTTIVLR